MKIPQPFLPLRAETQHGAHTVHVVGRDYTIGVDGLLTSIRSQGVELLAAPMRLVLEEDGEAARWDEKLPGERGGELRAAPLGRGDRDLRRETVRPLPGGCLLAGGL